MRFALVEVDRARARDDRVATRAWKLFLLFPRLLSHELPRDGQIPKSRLIERFVDFAEGRWAQFLLQSREWEDQAAVVSCRHEDDFQRRADRAPHLESVEDTTRLGCWRKFSPEQWCLMRLWMWCVSDD